jgi:hypothetical protein
MENKKKAGNSLHIAAISPQTLKCIINMAKVVNKKIVENKYYENKCSRKNIV